MYLASIPMSAQTKNFRLLALTSHILLLVLMSYWCFFVESKRSYSALFLFLVYILPLILPLPGILRGKPYTHAWVNFFILIYFMHGLTVVYAEPSERMFAILELLLATAMFVGCCMFARLRGRECGLGLTKLKDEMTREKAFFEGKK